MKMEKAECSETSSYKIQTPGKFFTPTCQWRWKKQNVPKRRHIKFRRRENSSHLPAYEDGKGRMFRNVGIQNSDAGKILYTYLPMKMEKAECSETSSYKIQTPGKFFTPTCLWRWKRQNVPKRRHTKFRRRKNSLHLPAYEDGKGRMFRNVVI